MMLGGDAIPTLDEQGEPIVGDTLLILASAHHEPLEFVLPAMEWGACWEVLVDTRSAAPPATPATREAADRYELEARSMAILRLKEMRPEDAAGTPEANGPRPAV
jgi:glycogen operon protein